MNAQFLPPMKRYMNAIEFHLRLPARDKRRVMADLISTVAARREAGETDDAIMADMGSPRQVADQFNGEMAGNLAPRKSPLRFLLIGLLLLLGVDTLGRTVWMVGFAEGLSQLVGAGSSTIGIIGGADGPTAIYVTALRPPLLEGLTFSPLGIALALAAAYWLLSLGTGQEPSRYTRAAILSGAGLAVFAWGYLWQLSDLLASGESFLAWVFPFLSPAFWLSLACLILALHRRSLAKT